MASPPPTSDPPYNPQTNWQTDMKDTALAERDHRERERSNGAGMDHPVSYPNNLDSATVPAPPSDAGKESAGGMPDKKIKPNKIYIGGLPEHTRQDDLRSCFGKIGSISAIELKLGYGFVEFDTAAAAQESVAKYNDGFFMGNKIRVELSHGGGRSAKYGAEPGACFKCGLTGHWARECPNHPASAPPPSKRPVLDDPYDGYPPPRDPYRDEYSRYPPPPAATRDRGYAYDYPPPRDRRPLTPPRDYRDYPARPPRDYDDYRNRPPPPRSYYPGDAYARPYDAPPRDMGPDRRVPPPDRYGSYGPRPRTPPGPPPSIRDFDRPPPRDYDYRGRLTPPPPPPVSGSAPGSAARYGDYPPRSGGSDQPRRRSQSPPRAGGPGYRPYGDGGYPPASGGPYSPSTAGFTGNGYSAGSVPPPPPPRSAGYGREREYSRGSVDSGYPARRS